MAQDDAKRQIHTWYHEHSNDLYNYIFFMIGEHDLAKDLLQDTFLRAYDKMDYFHGDHERNWLFRIARNITIDHLRKKRNDAFASDSIHAIQATGKVPEQIMLFNETEKQLYAALKKLKQSYYEVIILRKIKELSISETANVLGWSNAKVKVTLFRGMKALKKELEKEGYSHEAF